MPAPSPLVYESDKKLGHPGFLIFGIGKVLYVICIFVIFKFLENATTSEILTFLFSAHFCGAVLLCGLHRPWKSRKLTRVSTVYKLVRISVVHTLSMFALVFGMSTVGPTRFLLLEHLNIILTQLLSLVLASQQIQGARMQGCVIGLLGYFLCLWHDPTDSRISNDVHVDENTFDLVVGICAIGFAQIIQQVVKKTEKRLVEETGSLKKLQALQLVFALPVLGGLHLIQAPFVSSAGTGQSQGLLVIACGCLFITVRMLLVAWQHQLQIPENSAMRCSVSLCAGLATLLHLLHFDLSGTKPSGENATISSGTGLAIYTSAGLATVATFRFTAPTASVPVSAVFRVLVTHLPQRKNTFGFAMQALSQTDTRKLALFLSANVVFMAIEFAYGLMSNSQSLMSDSVHMIYDCVAVFIGFACSYMATYPATKEDNSFGYERLDVIGGFLNGIFLIMSSLSVFMCALERYFEPDKVHSEHLLVVSLLQVVLSGVGIRLFAQPADTPQTKRTNRISLNMKAVYLRVLSALCSAASCAVSSLLSHYLEWHFVDPLFSFLMVLLIWPLGVGGLLNATTIILLQRQPTDLDDRITFGIRELQAMDEELTILHRRFWTINMRHARGAVRVSAKTEPAQLHHQMDLLDLQMTCETAIEGA